MLRWPIFLFANVIICQAARRADIYWREYHRENIPNDAVVAGLKDHQAVYVGESIHKGYLIPGTIYPRTGTFVSEYYGKVTKTNYIKILCAGDSSGLQWERVDVDRLPNDLTSRAVESGYEEGTRWYIGRTFHQNEWKIGKVDMSGFKSLLVWNNDDDSLHRVYQFEMLTYV